MNKPHPADTLFYSGTATVVYVALNEGFWGLVTQNGQKLDLVQELPAPYQTEGLTVQISGRFRPGEVSIRMWGQAFELHTIRTIPLPDEADVS